MSGSGTAAREEESCGENERKGSGFGDGAVVCHGQGGDAVEVVDFLPEVHDPIAVGAGVGGDDEEVEGATGRPGPPKC